MTDTQPVRFGILGTGMVAGYHRDAILANQGAGARLEAVAHYEPSRFDRISEAFGVRCVDEETLVSDPSIDAVAICTPSGQHAAQAIAAARAGKHVLVEKPMALSLSDADRMIDVCRAEGVRLGVVYQRRFDPDFRAIRDALAEGRLGRPTMATLTLPYFRAQAYYDGADWRGTWALDGGGVLMNQGIHMIDVLVWFLGDADGVQARAETLVHDVEVEDSVVATIRFQNGTLATLAATTTASPGFPHRLEVFGTQGGMQMEGERLVRWSGYDPPVTLPEAGALADAGTGGDPRGIGPVGHIRAVADFVEAIQSGREPAVDGPEGRRSLALVLDVYRAAGLLIA